MRLERENPNSGEFVGLGGSVWFWYLMHVKMPYIYIRDAIEYSLKVTPSDHERTSQMIDQFAVDFFGCLDASSFDVLGLELQIPSYQLTHLYFTSSSWVDGKSEIKKEIKTINTRLGKPELIRMYAAVGSGRIIRTAAWTISWPISDELPRAISFVGVHEQDVLELGFRILPDRADRVTNLIDRFGLGEGQIKGVSEDGREIVLEYEYEQDLSKVQKRTQFRLIGEMETENKNYWIYGTRRKGLD